MVRARLYGALVAAQVHELGLDAAVVHDQGPGAALVFEGSSASFTSCDFTLNEGGYEGATVSIDSGGSATFASTLPANSFSGNSVKIYSVFG